MSMFFMQMAPLGSIGTNTSFEDPSQAFLGFRYIFMGGHYGSQMLQDLLKASLNICLQTMDNFFFVPKHQKISESDCLGYTTALPFSRCVTLGKLLNCSKSVSSFLKQE